MKLKPKVELRILAAVLLTVAVMVGVGTAIMVPDILEIVRGPWQDMFSSQFYHHHITAMIREVFFIIFPCIAAVNSWVAWKVLQHAKTIPDIR